MFFLSFSLSLWVILLWLFYVNKGRMLAMWRDFGRISPEEGFLTTYHIAR